MRTAVEPVKLNVEHVRKPGDRKPVGVLERTERPGEAFRGEAGAHMRVSRHVVRVVVIYEIKVADLTVDGGGHKHEKQGDEDVKSRVAWSSAHELTETRVALSFGGIGLQP